MNFRIPGLFIHAVIKQVLTFSHNHGYHLLSTYYRPGLMLSSCQIGFLSVSRADLSHSHPTPLHLPFSVLGMLPQLLLLPFGPSMPNTWGMVIAVYL